MVRVNGKMDAEQYIAILEEGLKGILINWENEVQNMIFQQDNDPKHTSKKAKKCLADNNFYVLDWPPQSLDLNTIYHLWLEIKNCLSHSMDAKCTVDVMW